MILKEVECAKLLPFCHTGRLEIISPSITSILDYVKSVCVVSSNTPNFGWIVEGAEPALDDIVDFIMKKYEYLGTKIISSYTRTDIHNWAFCLKTFTQILTVGTDDNNPYYDPLRKNSFWENSSCIIEVLFVFQLAACLLVFQSKFYSFLFFSNVKDEIRLQALYCRERSLINCYTVLHQLRSAYTTCCPQLAVMDFTGIAIDTLSKSSIGNTRGWHGDCVEA